MMTQEPTLAADKGTAQRDRRQLVVLGIALMVITYLAYLPAFSAGFTWGDDHHLTSNPALRTTQGLARIWTHPGAAPQSAPLTCTTFWMEYRLWGLDPMGYHAVNVTLHAASAVLIWQLLLCMGIPGSWLIAMVFAVHPVNVESVAWIAQRGNVLVAFLYLLSFSLYWRMLSRGTDGKRGYHAGMYAGALALFLAALLAGTTACTLPLALLLAIWWKWGNLQWRDVLLTLPMLVTAALIGSFSLWVDHHAFGGVDWDLSIVQRILIAGHAWWFYIATLLLPVDLAVMYPRWTVDATDWTWWLFPLAMPAVLAALFLLRRQLGRGPLAALLFFTLTLAPVLGLVNLQSMRYSFVADRLVYLAGLGVAAFVVGAIVTRARFLEQGKRPLAIIVVAVFACLTFRQSAIYFDVETLLRDTLQKNPDAWVAADDLATYELARIEAKTVENPPQLAAELEPLLQRVLERRPDEWAVVVKLGQVERLLGNPEAAIKRWSGVLDAATASSASRRPPARLVGEAAFQIGQYCEGDGRNPAMAASFFEKAVAADPTNVDAMRHQAALLEQGGAPDEAMAVLQHAARVNPLSATTWNRIGDLYLTSNLPADAIAAFQKSLDVGPNGIHALCGTAVAMGGLGNAKTAFASLDGLRAQWPDSADVNAAMGVLLARNGQTRDAVEFLSQSLQLQPDNPWALREMRTIQAANATKK